MCFINWITFIFRSFRCIYAVARHFEKENDTQQVTSAFVIMKNGEIFERRKFASFYLYIWWLQLTRFSCDDRENVYFILLSSSNRKYESLTIVKG